jgi:hypothetical protein
VNAAVEPFAIKNMHHAIVTLRQYLSISGLFGAVKMEEFESVAKRNT